MKLRGKQRIIIGVTLVVIANFFMLWLLATDALYPLQSFVNDLTMQKSAQTPDPRIVIAAIDDKSVKAYGQRGGWDRVHYANLIRNLKDGGARVAAFDVAFIDPTTSDQAVADAIRYAQSSQGGTPPMTIVMATEGDPPTGRVAGGGLGYQEFIPITLGIAGGGPTPANVTVDPDGAFVRHLPLRAVSEKEHYYLLPFVAVNAYLRRPPLDQDAKLQSNGILADGHLIPTDPYYRMLINYVGPPFAFTTISLSDLADKKVDLSVVKDKLVFVGQTKLTGGADSYPVPTSPNLKMDGVEIWANGAQNILNGKFVTRQGTISTALVMVVLSCLAAVTFFMWSALGWLAALGLMAIYSLGSFFYTVLRLNSATDSAQVISLPSIAYVDAGIFIASALPFMYFFIYEQRSRRSIHRMFGKYVTPEVAEMLVNMQESGELSLGGQVKDATIMFGDIRGFTTLSEGMEPEAVMAMLNRYFDKMVEIIIKHGGTINKFIGDNVMVLFNLPTPMQGNHALAACKAAFEIQEWITGYRQEHPEEVAAFGFGINTGELVVGNMGSQDRMEYTVIGEVVNVANSFCGTAERDEVAISESTWEAVKDAGVSVIDKGEVPVKGKTELIHIFSITGVVGVESHRQLAGAV